MSTFLPTKDMAMAAKMGLALRNRMIREGMKACSTRIGLKRADQLIKRKRLKLKTVKRMKAFFDRHEKNHLSMPPKCGYVSFLLWGGYAGWGWCEKILKTSPINAKV